MATPKEWFDDPNAAQAEASSAAEALLTRR